MVCVRRSLWERVTLREELVGRFRVGLRLPQYLGRASVSGIGDVTRDETTSEKECVFT